MFHFDVITNENNAEHNPNWPYIPDHPYRMLIIGDSASEKTTELLNLIREQDSDVLTDKIYLYATDLNEPKYQLSIKKREETGMYLDKPNLSKNLQNMQTLWMMFTIILTIAIKK